MLDDTFDDPAVGQAVFFSSFWNTGQGCAARTRLLVPRAQLNAAVDGLDQAAASWGDAIGGEAAFSSMQDLVASSLEAQKRSGHGVDCGLQGSLAHTTAHSTSMFN